MPLAASLGFAPWLLLLLIAVALLLGTYLAYWVRRVRREAGMLQQCHAEQVQYLAFLENLQRIDQAILRADSVDQLLRDVIDTVAEIFQCDRAWLLYPCNPSAESFRIPVERTRPEYPGALELGLDVPMSEPMVADCRDALATPGPVVCDPSTGKPVSADTARVFSVRSQIFICLRPRTGDPWLFGMHQCSSARVWTSEEQELLVRISRHIADALSNMILLQQLQESEDSLRQLSAATWEAIAIHDQGVLLEANRQFFDMFGYEREELINQQAMELTTTPESRDQIRERFASGDLGPYEVTGVRKGGSTFPIEIQVKMMSFRGHERRVAAIRDLTERKRSENENRALQERLARSKKMEAMGLMAGGVAHDLNNVLTTVVGYPDLLLETEGLTESVRAGLQEIKESGQRAADIVADLLTVARGVAIEKRALNLNAVIRDYLRGADLSALSQQQADVRVVTDLDPRLLNNLGSQVHIKKLLMNLVGNAYEAIEGDGKIRISTRNVYLDQPFLGYESIERGEYVVLQVSDSGSGIDPADLARIFEPFYTRKVLGRSGTGLGLSIVWNIVHDHAGHIDVNTTTQGTSFEVYLPATRTDVAELVGDLLIDDLRGQGQTVLVVDDEESQRRIAQQMLRRLGYEVCLAANGEEAVELLGTRSVDLLVLDMIMFPGINGCETYRRIAEMHPGQKAVIASGYVETEEVREAQGLGAGEFLRKPYTVQELGIAVLGELERKRN